MTIRLHKLLTADFELAHCEENLWLIVRQMVTARDDISNSCADNDSFTFNPLNGIFGNCFFFEDVRISSRRIELAVLSRAFVV